MNFKNYLFGALLMIGAVSCVNVDTDLGNGYIPIEQQYEVKCAEFELQDIQMKKLTNMSGYSSRRITVGALRDELFGLTLRSSAFTLVPVSDSLDFGTNPKYKDFHISLQRDTINVADDNQAKILQNIYVYSLRDAGINLNDGEQIYTDDIKCSMFDGLEKISKGIPVYDGSDSLSFSFSKKFGEDEFNRMLAERNEDNVYVIDSVQHYTDKFPGIFLTCDKPVGIGGRLNFFDVSIAQEDSYLVGNYAELKFSAEYDGERKDTSFLFIYGPTSLVEGSSVPDQYAFNVSENEDLIQEGTANEYIYIEGGSGVKPVFSAKEIRELIRNEFASQGLNPNDSSIVINKATIEMPFEFPSNYLDMRYFPETLCPVRRVEYTYDGEDRVTWANLTDSAISGENQGAIDRSNCKYSPDISYHAQRICWLRDTSKVDRPAPTDKQLANFDVWGTIIVTEYTTTSSSSSSTNSDYYNMLYYNYLNSMYGGYGGYGGYGYGSYGYGYGGYGGYGSSYGYNNYYNMMYYYSMLNSSSSSTTESSEEMDRDRYYRGILNGPNSSTGRVPKLKITYSFDKNKLK